MAGSSSSKGIQLSEEMLRATAAAGSVRAAGAKAGMANSTVRTASTTRVRSSYSRRLYVSNQEIKEEKPFSFGPVPTKAEAEDALSALQRLFFSVPYSEFFGESSSSMERNMTTRNIGSTEFGANRTESAGQLHQPQPSQSQGVARVFKTFCSMVSNPVVQSMVISLSSDKALWDAIMKNEVVQEIQESFRAESTKPENSEARNHDIVTIILRWILESAKPKIMDFVVKIMKVVDDLFNIQESESPQRNHQEMEENKGGGLDQVVRSAFMISIMVFMIIISKRMN